MLEKVDKTFLENAINEPISDFEISAGSKAGDNIAGSLKAIKVTTIKGKTVHLVMKIVSDDPEQQDYALRFGIYAIEGCVYSLVNPRITKLMEAKGIVNGGLPIPRLYGCGHNPRDPKEDYLLLEDVRPQGYIMPDKFRSLSAPEVALIMKELAKFHAKSYAWLKYEGEKVFDENDSIKRLRDSEFTKDDSEIAKIWAIYMTKNVQNGVEILRRKNEEDLAERVQKRFIDSEPTAASTCMRKIMRVLKESRTFPCLIHGDVWGNNVMIKYDKEGNPEDLKFLDFQITRRGGIYEDLGYFFMCSTSPEFRKNHLLQSLNVYFESFEGTLRQLKVPLPIGFSRGVLIDIFFELRLSYLAHMFFAIPLQLGLPIPEKKVVENGGGPPEGFDPSQMSPEEMMAMMEIQFEGKRKEILELTINSPPAVERLIGITREAVDAGLL